ncbi:MAG TPA: helix-turn-helix domain-containing protein [Thermoleophilaceae bacterium]
MAAQGRQNLTELRPRRFAATPTWETDSHSQAGEFTKDLLLREGDRFVREIVAAVQSEVEAFSEFPASVMGTLVQADIERAVRAISESRPPSEDELALSAATAANLARGRIPIEAVVQGRRVAIRRCSDLLRQATADAGLDPDAQVECIYRLWEWADAVHIADAEAYRAAELEMNSTGEEERAWFVRALIHGTLSPAEISGRATAYGLLPGVLYRAFRSRPAPGVDLRTLTRAIESSGADNGYGSLVVTIEGDVCGVVSRRPRLESQGVVGLGSETELARLSTSFELANRALETAVAFGYDGVVTMEDLSLRPAIMTEGHLGETLVHRYLDPLHQLGEFGTTLEETVREYLAHGMRIDESAKALYVHPNTLRHRLDRFQQLTGADLRNTQHVLEVWWALERRSLDARAAGVLPRPRPPLRPR